MYRRRKQDENYTSLKEVVGELNGGSCAFVADYANAYETLTQDFTYYDACRIREIPIPFSKHNEGTMVQKNSKMKRIIDYQ